MGTLARSILILLMSATITVAQNDVIGFTNKQLQSALSKTELTGQRLYGLQSFFSGRREDYAYLAVLSGSTSGRKISVFHHVKTGFDLEWDSGQLPTEFSSSDPYLLSVFEIGEESTVTLSGCSPHHCGNDYQGGIILYSPVRKEGFTALFAWKGDQPLHITFSKNALEPRNQSYKEALQKSIEEWKESLRRLGYLHHPE
jgi:hypothetical protein